jgi:hypothetical protein
MLQNLTDMHTVGMPMLADSASMPMPLNAKPSSHTLSSLSMEAESGQEDGAKYTTTAKSVGLFRYTNPLV